MKALGMTALGADFSKLCRASRDGSFATQANRLDILQSVAKALHKGGYGIKTVRGLKPSHINFLVSSWIKAGKDAGTIKNRMAHLRWCAVKTNKPGMIPRDNRTLGIPERQRGGDNKAQKLNLDKMKSVSCPKVRMSMRLMAAFGLRMEEAIKIRPSAADKGAMLALKSSWTKGGRYREVPIKSERQRALLDEAKALVGEGALIPDDRKYIQQRRRVEHQTLKAGFTNLHGLRHNYAQARFKAITGFACPMAGGKAFNELSAADKRLADAARWQVSQELGHNRIEITKTYLG